MGVDRATDWIFDAHDGRINIGINVGTIFKCQICAEKTTVSHGQMIDVAKPLIAFNRTVHERDILGVPRQILTVNC